MNPTIAPSCLQPLLFGFDDLSGCLFTEPSEKEKTFLSFWEALLPLLPASVTRERKALYGRPSYPLVDILAVWAVKLCFSLKTVSAAVGLLRSSPNLRMMTGMGRVPSEASVSRRTGELRAVMDIDGLLGRLCESFYSGRVIGHLSIDSTIVEAREKPVTRQKACGTPKKRGRKRKGSPEEAEARAKREEEERLQALEEGGDVGEYLSTLCRECSVTGKRNSKGHMQWRIGYKIHLAVDGMGIPVAYAVTGARVHDSRVAISLMRKAEARCPFLYALMDAGYCDRRIAAFAESMGKVAVMDSKAPPGGKKVPMDKAKAERYKARTTVERTNSEMKEKYLPCKLYSRSERALFEMEMAVLLTAMDKMAKALAARESA